MLRICQSVYDSKRKEKLKKSSNPKKISHSVDLFDGFSKTNISFYFTKSKKECLERLKTNKSDLATNAVSYNKNLDGYIVPAPSYVSQLQLVTGYKLNLSELKPHESATVMANVNLIDPIVHLSSLGLILSFILIVFSSILIKFKYSFNGKFSNNWSSSKRFIKKVLKNLIKELTLIYYGSSEKFNWISLLFTILTFYLITCFNCLYKTSQVIVPEPFVIKNYQMLLDDSKSLPIFYGSGNIIPNTFKFAPEGSIKKKIWLKMVKLLGNQINDIYNERGQITNYSFLRSFFYKMHSENSVYVSHWFANYMFYALCSLSPEDELWRIFKFKDESEKEELRGFPFSVHYNLKRSIVRQVRVFSENHLYMTNLINIFKQISIDIYERLNTTRQHQNEQRLVCSDNYKPHPDIDVHAIGLDYFGSFFVACLIICIIAFLILYHEKRLHKRRRKIRRQKRSHPSRIFFLT